MKLFLKYLLIMSCIPFLAMGITAIEPTGNPRQVSTMEHLYWISQHSESWGDTFEQIATINAAVTQEASYDAGQAWYPIGFGAENFTGSYNGNGFSIDSLKINRSASNEIGFFGSLDAATIQNLVLTNVNISGKFYVGAISGINYNSSTINNCSSSGSIQGNQFAGGISGYNSSGSLIEYCYSNADIYCNTNYINNKYAGGIAGMNYSVAAPLPTIRNCYCTGNIIASGGTTWLLNSFCGENQNGNISYCYSTGNVTYDSVLLTGNGFSRLLGGGKVINNFFDTESSGSISGSGATAKSTVDMKTLSTFTDVGWDFDNVWAIDLEINNAYPYLRNNSPQTATPITLSSFTATAKAGFIELSWETASETNNASFLIYRNGKALAKIDGAGTTTETNNYVYTDATVVPGVAYTYVLADIDYANNETKHEAKAVTVTLANDVVEADFVIGAAYPNPFNPTAVIPVNLTRKAVVNAKVYTLTGREVATIANGRMNAGSHNLRISTNNMTTGLYLVKVVVENVIDVQKIAFVK